MSEKLNVSFNAMQDFGILEDWVNEFLEDHDPVSIQMGILPDGRTQVMIVHRVKDESKDADKSSE